MTELLNERFYPVKGLPVHSLNNLLFCFIDFKTETKGSQLIQLVFVTAVAYRDISDTGGRL